MTRTEHTYVRNTQLPPQKVIEFFDYMGLPFLEHIFHVTRRVRVTHNN